MFKLNSSFSPTGDQPQAIEKLCQGIQDGLKNQVLVGVTGSGKTFTMANVIQKLQQPALIISHNKTLAGQLYQEMRDFFPKNSVSYFVSYYDYYQPEAYLPQTDTYIEKEADINELIDKLRLKATTDILTRPDAIVVASVSCIYNIGSPSLYGKSVVEIKKGSEKTISELTKELAQIHYDRSEFDFKRGSFRVRGEDLDVYPAYEDIGYRITIRNSVIIGFYPFEPLTGKSLDTHKPEDKLLIYPAKHYMTDPGIFQTVESQIRSDLKQEYEALKKQNKLVEAQRLLRRVNYDLEMIKEVGYVNGIENYSRYFDGRKIGDPPFSLLDYFKKAYGDQFLVFVDESHMTVPQLRGMFNGDQARKQILIDFGFRLKAAFDNRPLKFEEFYRIPPRIVYVSATPNDWELQKSEGGIAEQLIRPTGIVDPKIIIRPAKNEVIDLAKEIEQRAKKGEKVLVTTLTKKTAEDLSEYFKEKHIRSEYLHSDVATLERSDILDNLRKNAFDVLIGVNLLREGLDLPEVSLVAILDADKEGFLRSKTSLIQTMGRAARNISGEVILYADEITNSIREAVKEIDRRRIIQEGYNRIHSITPKSITKPVRERIAEASDPYLAIDNKSTRYDETFLQQLNPDSLTPFDKKRMVKKLENEMKKQANDLHFELAIRIREKIKELKTNYG